MALLMVSAVVSATVPYAGFAADCSQTSVQGLRPLTDLGPNTYNGTQGGLYPGGANLRPPEHQAAGVDLAKKVVPRRQDGSPDMNGSYVLLGIGNSTAELEFDALSAAAASDPAKDPGLVLVNGADFGRDAKNLSDPQSTYWTDLDARLAASGVTSKQVAVVWVNTAVEHADERFSDFVPLFGSYMASISRILHDRFPNLALTYLATRTYGGYASESPSPEPYANWTGFGVKVAIERQIEGDPALNFDPSAGPVEAPWLSWAPYSWANGTIARTDGLVWLCEDFRGDGLHPSRFGEKKTTAMLMDFFKADKTAREWFMANPAAPRPTLALSRTAGPPGVQVEVTGKGFRPFERVRVSLIEADGTTLLATPKTNESGSFLAVIRVPQAAGEGAAKVRATGAVSGISVNRPFTVT